MDRRNLGACLIAYVPVIHRGYVDVFRRLGDDHQLFVFDTPLIEEFDYLRKEIRALTPSESILGLCGILRLAIWPVGPEQMRRINSEHLRVAMPDEDVCHAVAQKYLKDCAVSYERTFLRWDRVNTTTEQTVQHDRAIAVPDIDRELLGIAYREAGRSSDWWRQVGALLLQDGQPLLLAHNRHLPTDYTPYIDGDPRNAFTKGVNIELGTALHAEVALISEAARRGTKTQGAFLYTTTFPCPPCAKAIAAAGIARCYFREGYSMLDGERVLKDGGVEIIRVSEATTV